MSAVRRLSIDPSSARVSAGATDRARRPAEKAGSPKSGRPAGTSPMIGTSVSHRVPTSVPAISAAIVGGRTRLRRAGHIAPTARVTAVTANALALKSPNASGQARTAPGAPPEATGDPSMGRVCMRMRISPIPDMNPEITEYGVYDTNRPIRSTPSRIWISPAMTTIVNTSETLSAWWVTIARNATDIGPVGPAISVRVPPRAAAQNPRATAP